MKTAIGQYIFSQEFGYGFDAVGKTVSLMQKTGIGSIETFIPFVNNQNIFDPDFAISYLECWKHEYKENGIKIPSVYLQFPFHKNLVKDNLSAYGDVLSKMASDFPEIKAVSVNPEPVDWDDLSKMKTEKELELQNENLLITSEILAKNNILLCYHFHKHELHNKAREMHFVLDRIPAEKLRINLDNNWVYFGGLDVSAFIEENFNRIETLHLRSSEKGIWGEILESGDEKVDEMLLMLWHKGFNGLHVVEISNDPKKTPTLPLEVRVVKSFENLAEWEINYKTIPEF